MTQRKKISTAGALAAFACGIAGTFATAQDNGLDGLFSGGANPFQILEDITGGEVPAEAGDLGGLLDGLLNAPLDTGSAADAFGPGGLGALGPLGDLLGGGFPGSASPGSHRAVPAFPSEAEIARAQSCPNAIGSGLPVPLENAIIRGGFGSGGSELGMARSLIDMLRTVSADPCVFRDILVVEALLDTLSGHYSAAERTLDALLPSDIDPQNGLQLLAQSAHASVLALQLRENDARDLIARLKPAVRGRFGPEGRLALALDGALADMDLALGRTARARSDEAQARALFERADLAYRLLYQRVVASPELGPRDELACLFLGAQATTKLLLGDPATAAQILSNLLDPRGDCGALVPETSLLGSRSLVDLGLAHLALGDLEQAASALQRGLDTARRLRGDAHPEVIRATRALAELHALQGDPDTAVALVSDMNESLLTWLGGSLRGLDSQALRRRVAALQASHQDLAMLLALKFPDHAGAQAAAAQSVLRYKGMQGEEDALFNRLATRLAEDPRAAALLEEISRLRSDLAAAAHAGGGGLAGPAGSGALSARELALAEAEAELQRLSGQFARQLAVRGADISTVQRQLGAAPEPGILVEYRLVSERDLGALEHGDDPLVWTAVVVTPDAIRTRKLDSADAIALRLGGVQDAELLSTAAQDARARKALETARFLLRAALVDPLNIGHASNLYLAPEGALTLAPFLAMTDADGSLWADPLVRRVTIVPSGRALIAGEAAPADGTPPEAGQLLALGDVVFGVAETGSGGFRPLPATRDEILGIREIAEGSAWNARILQGREAGETELRESLSEAPPGILHLASHGFYSAQDELPDRPSVLSGIALAGANRRASAAGADGVLYAVEVEALDLQRTALVVVSACDTGLGPVERGEGVHSLNRSFRIAGAGQSLVTLRPVGDEAAKSFMLAFYRHLFTPTTAHDGALDPTEAFQHTMVEMSQRADWIDFGAFTLMRHR